MKKKVFSLCCCLVSSLCAFAAGVERSVTNTTPNNLKSQLPISEWGTINSLTISGPLGPADITFLSNVAKATNKLEILDMAQATELLEIPKGAFANIKSLTAVSIPSSVNTISEKAFMDCINLSDVVLNEGLTTISDRAFYNDSLLTTITLPASLGELNVTALDGCNNLEVIHVNSENEVYTSNSGVLYTINEPTLVKYPVAKEDKSFIIPEGTIRIGNNAFSNCKLLKSVEMPSSVKSIGKNAFSNCLGFEIFIIGESVTDIADFAFAGCTNLTSISFPKSLKTIGDALVAKCCKITSIRCEALTPPTFSPLVDSPFVSQDYNICSLNISTCTLSIPAKSLKKYQEARGWESFVNKEGF